MKRTILSIALVLSALSVQAQALDAEFCNIKTLLATPDAVETHKVCFDAEHMAALKAAADKEKADQQAALDAQAKLPGVHIGDSAKWVRTSSSWGVPDKVNSTITKFGREEQWVYEGAGYLYFSNGKLTAIQHMQ